MKTIIYIISNPNTHEYFIATNKQILPDGWQWKVFDLSFISFDSVIDKCYQGYRIHVPICFE
jgi:hypothetical protein